MNKTNDTDDSMDTNIDIDNPINYYILLIKIGSIISIILYIMVIFSYFFFQKSKKFHNGNSIIFYDFCFFRFNIIVINERKI